MESIEVSNRSARLDMVLKWFGRTVLPTMPNEAPCAAEEAMSDDHEHNWEVEYLPDPMSAGGVVRSGALFCTICQIDKEDK